MSIIILPIKIKTAILTNRGLLAMGYKKDIFAVFAYEFEPSHKKVLYKKALFYALFLTGVPDLGVQIPLFFIMQLGARNHEQQSILNFQI